MTERSRRAPTWPRVAVVLVLIGITFFVSRSCQQSQIEISQDEAVQVATEQIDFKPDDYSIRLLRQGLDTRPFWIVIFYRRRGEELITRAQVYINAKTGSVTKVNEVRPRGAPATATP